MAKLSFKLVTATIPVTLETPEGNIELEIREMSAASRDLYLDDLSTRMRLDAQGNPLGLKKFEGLQAGLLFRCLFRKDGKAINEADIQAWPASVVSELFTAAQSLNHLGKAEDPLKNG